MSKELSAARVEKGTVRIVDANGKSVPATEHVIDGVVYYEMALSNSPFSERTSPPKKNER